jgi:ATP-dependent Lhr-like helicase
MVERFREKLTNESLAELIARMVSELERSAGGEAVGTAHASADQLLTQRAAPEADIAAGLALETRGETPAARGPRQRKDGRARRRPGAAS